MGADFTKTSAGETIGFWRKELERSLDSWKVRDGQREELRAITSELNFGNLVFADDDDRDANPWIDQRDFNILLVALDRMRSLAGDEQPEVRFSRSMTGMNPKTNEEITLSKTGEIQDRLVMRAMAQAGAPEENADGVGAVSIEGPAVYWWGFSGFPSREEAIDAAKSVGQVANEAGQGLHEPGRMQDHALVGQTLVSAALGADPKEIQKEAALTAPGEGKFEQAAAAGGEHLDLLQAEEKIPLYWRDGGKFQLRCTRLPVGTHFRTDATRSRWKDVRFQARLHEIPLDEARAHPAFRPAARSKLEIAAFEDDPDAGTPISPLQPHQTDGDPEKAEEANGYVKIWQILDRKWGREYFIPEEGCGDQILQDRPAPYVDERGASLLKPAGAYSGFFPTAICIGKTLSRNTPQKLWGMPTLLPGLKGQKLIIKLISEFAHAVKVASSALNFVHQEIYDKHEDDLQANRSGVYPWDAALAQQGVLPSVYAQWKPPSAELFREIQVEQNRVLTEIRMPIAIFSGQPQAETARAEDIALAGGNEASFEIIRQMEMCYSVQAHICLKLIQSYYTDEMIDELIGPVDRAKLRAAWETIGEAPDLPDVTYAAKSRSQANMFGRVKMLLDLHERTKAEVDPITGAPRLESIHLLQEAAMTINAGKLPPFEISQNQQIIMAATKKLMEAEGKTTATAGKSPDSQGKPRGRRENAGRRDSGRGRSRGQPNPDAGKAVSV